MRQNKNTFLNFGIPSSLYVRYNEFQGKNFMLSRKFNCMISIMMYSLYNISCIVCVMSIEHSSVCWISVCRRFLTINELQDYQIWFKLHDILYDVFHDLIYKILVAVYDTFYDIFDTYILYIWCFRKCILRYILW